MLNSPTVLILSTSTTLGLPYTQIARRLQDAFTALGINAVHTTLDAVDETQSYSLCLLLQPTLLPRQFVAPSLVPEMRDRLQELVNDCPHCWFVMLEPLSSPDYPGFIDYAERLSVDGILDVGWYSQAESYPPDTSITYAFMYCSLTEAERAALVETQLTPQPVFPWVFIGSQTERRVRLVHALVENYHPGGFVCLIPPGMRQQGMFFSTTDGLRVQRLSRYSIWCSGDIRPNYIEPLRIPDAVTTGTIPVKMVKRSEEVTHPLPFDYILLDEEAFIDQLHKLDPQSTWLRLKEELLQVPSLDVELTRFLNEIGLQGQTA